MTATRRSLKMHPKLLLDVVNRQAGSLHKAVLEGVMNAIEAGASRVDIGFNVDANNIAFMSITDDGKGIKTEDEIIRFFETFGTPHDESEGKIWAQFRMGRGQLFSFGKNTWQTGEFKMFVDIQDENMGLDYDLQKGLNEYDGCRIDIELYNNPIANYSYPSIDALSDSIQEQVEFMDTPVYFNGKKLNRKVDGIQWTDEDEYAYYLFGVGSDLAIYNVGAYVCKRSTWQAGVSGIVLSKMQLKVNFARNDVQHDCPIFGEIEKVIARHRRKKVENRQSALTDDERTALMLDMRDGGIDLSENKNISLVRTATGRALSLAAIMRNRLPWTFAPKDNIKADKLMQQEKALIFDESLLFELRYSAEPKEFFTWLVNASINIRYYNIENSPEYNKWKKLEKLYVSFEELTEGFSESFIIFSDNQLSIREKFVLRALDSYNCWDGRVLAIGSSTSAAAWTNGHSRITIDRDWLKGLHLPSDAGTALLINVLVHELAHDCDTSGSHVHGEEFYRRFHDLCVRTRNPIQRIMSDFYNRMNRSKRMIHEEKEAAHKQKLEAKKQEALAASTK